MAVIPDRDEGRAMGPDLSPDPELALQYCRARVTSRLTAELRLCREQAVVLE